MRYFFTAIWLLIACMGRSQTGPTGMPCAQYNNPNQPPPARFNYVMVLYAGADSYVLISDQSGKQIGAGSNGKLVTATLLYSAFEDDFLAGSEAGNLNWPEESKPEMIHVQFPTTGPYVIRVTSRNGKAQSLAILTSTCEKRWRTQVTIPASRAGDVRQLRLVYDPLGSKEPQLLGPEPVAP